MAQRDVTPLPINIGGGNDLVGAIQAGSQLRQLLQPQAPQLGGSSGPGKQKRDKEAKKREKAESRKLEDIQAHDIEVEKLRQQGRTTEQETESRLAQEGFEHKLSLTDQIAEAEAKILEAKEIGQAKAAVKGLIEAYTPLMGREKAQQAAIAKLQAQLKGDKLANEQVEAQIALLEAQKDRQDAETRGVDWVNMDGQRRQTFEEGLKEREQSLRERIGDSTIDLHKAQIAEANAKMNEANAKAAQAISGVDPNAVKEHMRALSIKVSQQDRIVGAKLAKIEAMTRRLDTMRRDDPARQTVEQQLKTARSEYSTAVTELQTRVDDYASRVAQLFEQRPSPAGPDVGGEEEGNEEPQGNSAVSAAKQLTSKGK